MGDFVASSSDVATIYQGPTRVWISGPSIIKPKTKFSLRFTLLRADGYPAEAYEGKLFIKENEDIKNLPEFLFFTKEDRGSIVISDCYIENEGIYSFEAVSEASFPTGTCHPIWVRSNFEYSLFWGDLHVHSAVGKCGIPHLPKSPDYGYWFAKEVVGHDFCSITDHASNLDDNDWETIKKAANEWNKPGEFLSILGFEGDYDGEDGGHYNLYFSSDDGVYKNFMIRAGGTLDAIFEYANKHNALAISHHASRSICGRDFSKSSFGGQNIEPVMEVYSQWGSSEEYASSRPTIEGRYPEPTHYYRYALKNKYKLGVVGGSDSHCTTPGGPVPMIFPQWGGKLLFPYPGGATAVFAKELTRENLFEAIRSRRCYATSFEKILVWIEAHSLPMGSEIQADRAEIDITIACGHGTLIEVIIVKNGEVAAVFDPAKDMKGFDEKKKVFQMKWHDKDFIEENSYYVRATQFDGDMAWSSPIWIRPM